MDTYAKAGIAANVGYEIGTMVAYLLPLPLCNFPFISLSISSFVSVITSLCINIMFPFIYHHFACVDFISMDSLIINPMNKFQSMVSE